MSSEPWVDRNNPREMAMPDIKDVGAFDKAVAQNRAAGPDGARRLDGMVAQSNAASGARNARTAGAVARARAAASAAGQHSAPASRPAAGQVSRFTDRDRA